MMNDSKKLNNILIIEDSRTINNIIKKELSKLGFNVSQAFRLSQAREHLKDKEYKLIILDLHLPDGEGSELIADIQSLSKTKIVVLTSEQDKDIREELFSYGILDYILKDTNLLYSIAEIIKIIHTMSGVHKGKILIIDDSSFICKQVQTILKPRNYKIDYALSAKEGLIKLYKESYNLLILDMELPDIHGLKLLEIIRKKAKFHSLPVMVLSGTTTPEIIRNVLKNGANDIMKKPFVFEEFVLKVDLWVDYFKQAQELKETNKQLNYMNENLETLVEEELVKNRQKDRIMFSQSRQAQMGEMIAMIAHQWRQPLNVIATASSVIKYKINKGSLNKETATNLVDKISQNISYLDNTINDFRNFFKKDKDKVKTDFKIIAKKAIALISADIEAKKIDFSFQIISVKSFLSYENEILQVLLNLLKNAEDILVDKKIKLPKIIIIIDNLNITVVDNGGGIPPEIIDKIYNPYFSTKLAKEGTGLGLYMSKTIIEEHCGGKLVVKNSGDGASFTISLPEGDIHD